MSIPSSSARRRNAPNLISPLHRAHGFGVRPASCSAAKSASTVRSNSSVRSQISNGNPAILAVSAASRRALGPQHPWSTPSRCTSACATRARRSPARGAGTRRPRNRRRRTSRPARTACESRLSAVRLGTATTARSRSRIVPACSKRDSTTSPAPRRRSGSWNRSACWRRRAPMRSSARSRRPRRRPGAASGSPGSWPTRPRPASTPPSSSAPATPTTRSPPCPWRGSRCSSGAEETMLPLPRDDGLGAAAEGTWMPTTTARPIRVLRRPRSGSSIAAGETYQVNHTMRLRSRVKGDPRGSLPRPLLRAARRVLRLPRPRALPHPLRLAGALLRARRRRDRHEADEGHRAARAVAGGGSRRRGAPPRPPRRTAPRTR